MTACADRQMVLQALLDDELDAANVAAIEAHMAACPDCAAELSQLRAVRGIVTGEALRSRAPESLLARIEAALPPSSRANPWPARLGWASSGAGVAIAASLALMLAAPPPAEPDVGQQLVSSHIRSLLADHLVDIQTSDRHVVKPWFNGKIDFSPPTPDLTAQGFPLVGGRLDYIGDRTVAAIVYRRRLHTINLFVWPTGPREPHGSMQMDGYTVRRWTRNGLSYYAVSDIASGDLAQFETSFVSAQ
ncbi:MAG: anti-sigma factor [Candidatus Sphingomonas colombiensis]|nr:anti-sigma factor [Sphingomonas sp.]WEK42177.1 MAG: anti-sigma factor [Sphingomonas sp.]